MAEHIATIQELQRGLAEARQNVALLSQELGLTNQKLQLLEQDVLRLKQELASTKQDLEAAKEEEPMSLEAFLRASHPRISQCLESARKSHASNAEDGAGTGRYYPMRLRPSTYFVINQQGGFSKITGCCSQGRISRPHNLARHAGRQAHAGSPRDHDDGDGDGWGSELAAIEAPVLAILERIQEDTDLAALYALDDPQFIRSVGREDVLGSEADLPDGRGIRENAEGVEVVFVYEHEPADDLTVEDVRAALANEKLFVETMARICRPEETGSHSIERDAAELRVVEILTRAYHHMLMHGVGYGYIVTRSCIVFLLIQQGDLRTLEYYVYVPGEAALGHTGATDAFDTIVAQVASFCLRAFGATRPLTGHASLKEIEAAGVQKWRAEYDDYDSYWPLEPEPPARPSNDYCTQACLLGLKRGLELDTRCPNAVVHRAIKGGSCHPIDLGSFTRLVEERLNHGSPYELCAAVDPHALAGQTGNVGTLFKIELAPYGYTFVAKGATAAHRDALQHETVIYSRLEALQGEVVPVHLGVVDLGRRGYMLPSSVEVSHMMLMSWGGEGAWDCPDAPADLGNEKRRLLAQVRRAGVRSHDDDDDDEEYDLLWNKERWRVMIVNFDEASYRAAPATRTKRKREEDSGEEMLFAGLVKAGRMEFKDASEPEREA